MEPARDREIEHFRAWTGLFGTVVVPLVIALAGWWVATAIEEQQTSARLVELGIDILSQEPAEARYTEREQLIRRWAVDVLDEHSTVRLGQEARRVLIESSALGPYLPESLVRVTVEPRTDGQPGSASVEVEGTPVTITVGSVVATSDDPAAPAAGQTVSVAREVRIDGAGRALLAARLAVGETLTFELPAARLFLTLETVEPGGRTTWQPAVLRRPG